MAKYLKKQGGVTYLKQRDYSKKDSSFKFVKADGILDLDKISNAVEDKPYGQIDSNGTTLATTVVTAGTFYKMEGSMDLTLANQFDNPDNGRLRYVGENERIVDIMATLDYTSNTNNHNIIFQLRKNGEAQTSGEITVYKATSTDTGAVSIGRLCTLNTNDYIEVWVSADVNGVEIIKQHANLRILAIT